MDCELYEDFYKIGSFLHVFGCHLTKDNEDLQYFSLSQVKLWVQGERRQNEIQFRNFLIVLLRQINNSKSDKFQERGFETALCGFLNQIGEGAIADFVQNCGLNILRVRQKLKILRILLEFQLQKNRLVEDYCRVAKGWQLRPEPLGRDSHGNVFWRFDDRFGKGWTLVKEIASENETSLCVHVNAQVIRDVLEQIRKFKPTKYCAPQGEKCNLRKKQATIACGKCKKSWHENCVQIYMTFDQDAWQCPVCDQKDLLLSLENLVE